MGLLPQTTLIYTVFTTTVDLHDPRLKICQKKGQNDPLDPNGLNYTVLATDHAGSIPEKLLLSQNDLLSETPLPMVICLSLYRCEGQVTPCVLGEYTDEK